MRGAPREVLAFTLEDDVIAVYAHNSLAPTVGAALGRLKFQIVSRWSTFERLLPTSRCGVLVIERLHLSIEFQRLCALRRERDECPIVLVTRPEPESLRLLKDLVVEEVLWLQELRHNLPMTVQRASIRHPLGAIAAEIQAVTSLGPRLRFALVEACRSNMPVHSVVDLASRCDCDRRTLWRAWNASGRPGNHIRLEDVLGWIILIHAISIRTSGRGWSAVAAQLAINERRIYRLSERLLHVPLCQASEIGSRELVTRFHSEVITPILCTLPTETRPGSRRTSECVSTMEVAHSSREARAGANHLGLFAQTEDCGPLTALHPGCPPQHSRKRPKYTCFRRAQEAVEKRCSHGSLVQL